MEWVTEGWGAQWGINPFSLASLLGGEGVKGQGSDELKEVVVLVPPQATSGESKDLWQAAGWSDLRLQPLMARAWKLGLPGAWV